MASECLFTGKVKCLDGDTSEIVAELTYGTPSKTVPAKAWSDPTSDPLSDLRGALRLVPNQRGASADLIVMGKDAADAFESNANVLAAYDKLRISSGELTPKNVSWGVQSLGTYRGLPLYVDESEYQDTDGGMKPFVPPDCVLVASSSLAGCFAYAGVAQVDQDERTLSVYEGRRIPADQLREHGRHSQVSLVFATRSRPTEPERVDDPRRALIFNHRKEKTL